MKLAKRIGTIKPSPTLAITAKAKALRAAGQDVIGFGAGEPDFDTPRHIKDAAIKAIEEGFTKYTAAAGTDELKDAIIRKLERDNHLSYGRSEIVVSCGAKHTLYNIAQVLFDEGDEVIILSPYWVSYPAFVLLAGATPVIVETAEKDGFKLTPDALRNAVTERTKAIILNSPSNPTGASYTADELTALADVIVDKDIIAISDDIYEKIIYDDFEFSNIANAGDAIKARTIVVNGVSKSYAMTGWRIGYGAGPEEIMSQVSKIQSQNTSNPTSIAQRAAEAALSGPQECVGVMVEEFAARRDVIVKALRDIPGITCMNPTGAFYVFPDISSFFGARVEGRTISGSEDFAEFLLDKAKVAVVPGSAFGDDRYMRLSYATSMEAIEKGTARIKDALTLLS